MTGAVVKALRECAAAGDRGGQRDRRRRRRGDRARLRLPPPGATRPRSRSCSRRSGWPAPTWARPTCCRASSASAARPSCCCSATRSRHSAPSRSGSPPRSSTTTHWRGAGARRAARATAPRSPTRPPRPCSPASSTMTWPLRSSSRRITQALLMHSDGLRRVLRGVERGRKPMERPMNEIVNAPELPGTERLRATRCGAGDTVYLAGQIGDGATVAEQFDDAAGNLLTRAAAAGGEPRPPRLRSRSSSPTSTAYRAALQRARPGVWREHFGRHFPAMGLFGVTELFDPAAMVELMGVAVVARVSRARSTSTCSRRAARALRRDGERWPGHAADRRAGRARPRQPPADQGPRRARPTRPPDPDRRERDRAVPDPRGPLARVHRGRDRVRASRASAPTDPPDAADTVKERGSRPLADGDRRGGVRPHRARRRRPTSRR